MDKSELFKEIETFIKPAAKLKNSKWTISAGWVYVTNDKHIGIISDTVLFISLKNKGGKIGRSYFFELESSKIILEFLMEIITDDIKGLNFLDRYDKEKRFTKKINGGAVNVIKNALGLL